MIALRPQQQTALALLGYKLWLPRAELAALRATLPAPSADREKTAPAVASLTATTAPATNDATILPLPGIHASVHLARDYTLLSGEALRCHWLMPPLWSEAGRLMPFASENERRLLLALFHAIDCDEALRLFTAPRRQPRPACRPGRQTAHYLRRSLANRGQRVWQDNLKSL